MPDASTICVDCETTVAPDLPWCPLCRSSLVDSSVGELADPSERLQAGTIDALVPVAVGAAVFASVVYSIAPEASDVAITAFMMIVIAFGVASFYLFATGRSVGKALIGLHVVDRDLRRADFWTMLLREVPGKLISALVGGLGFAMIPIDKSTRGWHDYLASTFVVKTSTGTRARAETIEEVPD